jgi:FtsH-binding integral membrane protein
VAAVPVRVNQKAGFASLDIALPEADITGGHFRPELQEVLSMADFDRSVRANASTTTAAIDVGLRAYMLQVYNYMLGALALTGVVAWAIANVPSVAAVFFAVNPANNAIGLTVFGMVGVFAPLAFVLFLSFRIQQMSLPTAQVTFWLYAAVMGISIASILFIFTGESVARVFFITAATFGAMSLWGYTTKRDLSGWGSFLFMGLIGIIIASVVNIFIASSMMQWVISVIGVLVFTGLTAYDTQRIKESYYAGDDGTVAGKKAVMGALRLYLDFINLFMMLMQLLGNRR